MRSEFADLALRYDVAFAATTGESPPLRHIPDESQLREAANSTPLLERDDLRGFYLGFGIGVLGWLEVLELEDHDKYGDEYALDVEEAREMLSPAELGDLAADDPLVFGIEGSKWWLFDSDPTRPRIVTYQAGFSQNERSAQAAPSLIDFVRCIVEIAETGTLPATPPEAGYPRILHVADHLGGFAEIRQRHGVSEAIFGVLG